MRAKCNKSSVKHNSTKIEKEKGKIPGDKKSEVENTAEYNKVNWTVFFIRYLKRLIKVLAYLISAMRNREGRKVAEIFA